MPKITVPVLEACKLEHLTDFTTPPHQFQPVYRCNVTQNV